MATSTNPGLGMSQSIAFAHIHVSLFPRNVSVGEHIHGMQVQESNKPIPYTPYSFHGFRGNFVISREGGVALSFDSGRPLSYFQSQNAERITQLLSAANSAGVAYGTQWVIHRESSKTRTL